jgi:cell division protease FtsH
MDEGLGCVAYEPPRATTPGLPAEWAPGAPPLSPDTQGRIDSAIRALVMAGLAQATMLLQQHRALLERGALALLERETLDEAALRELTVELRPPTAVTHTVGSNTANSAPDTTGPSQ